MPFTTNGQMGPGVQDENFEKAYRITPLCEAKIGLTEFRWPGQLMTSDKFGLAVFNPPFPRA